MTKNFNTHLQNYSEKLVSTLKVLPVAQIENLADALLNCWKNNRQVFIFGNGGSAGNAIHLANDFLYGVSKQIGNAIRIHSLSANSSVLTCLANDVGYDRIYSHQLAVLANPGDIAIALSGSGNSPNIVEALKWCNINDVKSFAILGYDGGKAKNIADTSIHIAINDMQISEDLQVIIGHMLMQWLYTNYKTNPWGKNVE